MFAISQTESVRRQDEIDRFKRDIDLVAFVQANGYELRQNSGHYARLAAGHRDEVIVSRRPSRRTGEVVWVWCDPRNVVPSPPNGPRAANAADGHQGSIFDFVRKKLKTENLGEIRKLLRVWSSDYRGKATERPPSLQPTAEPDRAVVARWLADALPATTSRYLASRGLRPETLAHWRFSGTVRETPWGEVRFEHSDRKGACGFERKSRGLSMFAPSGTRGLWCSKAFKGDKALVVSEASIECLSFHQLHPDGGARFVSTGGSISYEQAQLLEAAVKRLPADASVVVATNNDDAGHRMAALITDIAREARPGISIARPLPPHGKDWNETLQVVERDFIASQTRTRGLK
jgi:hypothetical protein